MFENAELGSSLTKPEYKKAVGRLRVELLEAQHRLAASDRSLVVIIGGVEGGGKSEFANALLAWLDARGIETHALGEPTDEERDHPYFWRFWRRLPASRRAGIFLTSWYTRPIVDRVFKDTDEAEFDQDLDRIVEFERMLCQEKTVLVKLWLHISKKEQAKRLKALEKDEDTSWRVTKLDWKYHKKYARFRKVSEHALIKTSTGEAPWRVIDSQDHRYRDVTAARVILEALTSGLDEAKKASGDRKPDRPKPAAKNVIRALDMSLSLSEDKFESRYEDLRNRLGFLTRELRRKRRSLILAFEGPDAAGKGGAIRRLTKSMDARLYRVNSVAAPSDEERAHPYLWRFWRALPRLGTVTIYDRTWYGRVLVERIEGFATAPEWKRAFAEINAFEKQLSDYGTTLLKFWIAISADEQLRRFKSRQTTPYKQYKITEEDWRNREKWNAYEAAACEMVEKTSTDHAPWVLIEGNDKRWARIRIMETVVERLEKELA
ncbi:MAG: polyphosphate:AMP phosphotransferase [Elusimicrobia bacterium]|nr:polyphosphate:AMP phosphotransferase [Elusimicrobiota bacterium]